MMFPSKSKLPGAHPLDYPIVFTASSGVCRRQYPKASVAPAGIVLSISNHPQRHDEKKRFPIHHN